MLQFPHVAGCVAPPIVTSHTASMDRLYQLDLSNHIHPEASRRSYHQHTVRSSSSNLASYGTAASPAHQSNGSSHANSSMSQQQVAKYSQRACNHKLQLNLSAIVHDAKPLPAQNTMTALPHDINNASPTLEERGVMASEPASVGSAHDD